MSEISGRTGAPAGNQPRVLTQGELHLFQSALPWGAGTKKPAPPADADLLTKALHGNRYIGTHPMTTGNDVQLIREPEELRRTLLHDMRQARQIIGTQNFMWGTRGHGEAIAKTGAEQGRKGVEFLAQIDAFGHRGWAYKNHREFFQDIASGPNVRIRSNWPMGIGPTAYERAIDHRKVYFMDSPQGLVAYLSTLNPGETDSHRDVTMRFQGPAAAEIAADYVGRWHDIGGTISDENLEFLRGAMADATPRGETGVEIIPTRKNVVDGGTENFYKMIDQEIDRARRGEPTRLWMATPHIGDAKQVQRVIEAAQAGVDTHVVLKLKPNQRGFLSDITESFFPELVKGGVNVHVYDGQLHNKVVMNSSHFMLGSFNPLTLHSRNADYELGANIFNDKLYRQVEGFYKADLANSSKVTLENLDTLRAKVLPVIRKLAPIHLVA